MRTDKRKVALIGTGMVGMSYAYSMLNQNICDELVLIDINKKRAEGEAMDLNHGLAFSASNMKIYAGEYKDTSDADIAVICAGVAQKPGESRLNLLKRNAAVFKSIVDPVTESGFNGIFLVATNPVDIMTYVALKLSGYPRNKVIGSGTVLDTARLKYLLSRHLDVDSRSIHAFIIGEHGDSELAVWSAANVSGIPLNHFCELRGYFDHMESMDRIYQSVRDSAYEIIEKKGATYYGVAMAVCRIAESVIRNEHSIMPISVYLDGLYGLHDICLSIPTVVGQEGAEKVLDIPLDLMEMGKLVYSAEELKKIIGELEL